MARSFNGSTQYFNATPPFTTFTGTYTFSGWFNCTNGAAEQYILCASNISNDFWFYSLGVASNTARAYYSNDGTLHGGGSYTLATSSGTFTNATWNHACGVISSSTCTVWLNGTKTTGSTTGSPVTTGSVDALAIGVFKRTSGNSAFFGGSLAECAVWNATLTDQEASALAAGTSPTRVRPLSLIGYWPMFGLTGTGGNEPDLSGNSRFMTNNGVTPPSNHAPLDTPTKHVPTQWTIASATNYAMKTSYFFPQLHQALLE